MGGCGAQNELDQERGHIRELLDSIRDIRGQQRTEMQAGIEATLQTPMQSAAALIIGLIHTAEEQEQFAVAVPLSKVLKQITAANLYAPGFRFKDDVDTDTRRWIAETFSPQVARGKRSAAAPTAADSPARPPSPKALAPVAQDLPLLTFNQFSYQEDELAGLARAHFDTVTKFGLLEEFRIEDSVFDSFVGAVRKQYNAENAYHNYRHAFDPTRRRNRSSSLLPCRFRRC